VEASHVEFNEILEKAYGIPGEVRLKPLTYIN